MAIMWVKVLSSLRRAIQIITLLVRYYFEFIMHSSHNYSRTRTNENKANKINQNHKDYQDEQDMYQIKHSDSLEVRQLKAKLKVLVSKLATGKKQRDQLHKQNENLQKEVMELQNNLRHMVAGFANSSSAFPMANELAAKIAQFYKCDCLDIFFDVLGPEELTLKGVIYFYMQTFALANKMIDEYFEPALAGIKKVGCQQSLEGPVLNVLRKAFQTKHREILQQIQKGDKINRKLNQLIEQLGLGSNDKQEITQNVSIFFAKLLEISLECKICDPPLMVEVGCIGRRVEFSNLSHDPFDGFIKNKEQCFIILPQVHKQQSNDLITKALVLHKNYDPTN